MVVNRAWHVTKENRSASTPSNRKKEALNREIKLREKRSSGEDEEEEVVARSRRSNFEK